MLSVPELSKIIKDNRTKLREWGGKIKLLFLPVFGDPSSVFLHGGGRTHAIEQLEFLALLLNHLPSRFRVTRKHSSQHHKIGTSTKRLGYITRTRTASVLIKEGIIGVIVKSIYIGVTVLSIDMVVTVYCNYIGVTDYR